jgi:hypothetical protein
VQNDLDKTSNFRIRRNVIVAALHALAHRLKPLILGLAAALALVGCGGSRSRPHVSAGRPQLISIFEDNGLMSNPVAALDQLRRLGVQYVRVLVRWNSIAPSPSSAVAPAHFNASSPASYPAAGWAPYDAIVRDAAARHMGVLFDITGGAPQWATGPGFQSGGAAGVWKPSASLFEPFVAAVGRRYSGSYTPPGAGSPLPRVSFWSIWNEPNLGEADLAPQSTDNSTVEVSPLMYRQLLDAGWSALHRSGHGHDTILIVELAPYGQSSGPFPGIFGYMVPLRFVRALYCVDKSLHPLRGTAAAVRGCPTTASGSHAFARQHPALFQASGFAVHPYPSGGIAPNVVLPFEPDFVYLATLSRLTSLLHTVTREYGSSRLSFPLYSTEYGYRTIPPQAGVLPVAQAPAYENWAEYLAWRNPQLRSWDHYLMLDPPAGSPSKFVTGLKFANGASKPTYAAYRLPIYLPATSQHRGGLAVWGCVRPIYYEPSPQHAQIQLQPASGGSFKTVTSVSLDHSTCYFEKVVRFPASGNVRIAWTYPGGPTIYSREVAITTGH